MHMNEEDAYENTSDLSGGFEESSESSNELMDGWRPATSRATRQGGLRGGPKAETKSLAVPRADLQKAWLEPTGGPSSKDFANRGGQNQRR